jgi:hypothetical protein
VSKVRIVKIGAALMSICILPMPVYADSGGIIRQMVMEIGRPQLIIASTF